MSVGDAITQINGMMLKLSIRTMWVILGLLCMASVLVNLKAERLSAQDMNEGKSSLYMPGNSDPLAEVKPNESIPIQSERFPSILEINNATLVELSFAYRCTHGCGTLWIEIGDRNRYILAHPIFSEINWFGFEHDNGYTLYQREPRYHDLKELFMDPNRGVVLADESYVTLLQDAYGAIEILENSDSIGDADYVVSTMGKQLSLGEWTLFYRVIDVSKMPPSIQVRFEGDEMSIQGLEVARWQYRQY